MPATQSSSEIAYNGPMKILVIEDDREAADYLQKAFAEAGHTAHVAGDGETGFALADAGDYDVMVIDRMMPRRDGLSVIAGLRSRGNTTPVLILSALGEVDDRVTGLRAGGDDYLTKPYAFSELARPRRGAEPPRQRQGSRNRLPGRRSRARPSLAFGHAAPRARSRCSRANSACSNI